MEYISANMFVFVFMTDITLKYLMLAQIIQNKGKNLILAWILGFFNLFIFASNVVFRTLNSVRLNKQSLKHQQVYTVRLQRYTD